jgi:hypothetical protein
VQAVVEPLHSAVGTHCVEVVPVPQFWLSQAVYPEGQFQSKLEAGELFQSGN